MLRDALPERDLSEDRKQITATLLQRNPWLWMLSNREAILNQLTERIAWERRLITTNKKLNSLPDPAKTYLSDEIDRRTRTRAPVYRQMDREFAERDKYKSSIEFNLSELVSVEMRTQAVTGAGTAALIEALKLKKHHGWIALDSNGLDAFRYGLTLQIDGTWLPIDNQGIHAWSFFRALGARADAKFISVWREAAYGGTKSIDIVALSDKAELVFGEVKHWSTTTWQIPKAEQELLAQLERHNDGITEIAKNMNRRTKDVKARVLFVSRDGFAGLERAEKIRLAAEIEKRGWKLNLIADDKIEDFGALIDRVR